MEENKKEEMETSLPIIEADLVEQSLFDEKKLTGFTRQDILEIKDQIRVGGLVFEASMINELQGSKLNGEDFNAASVVKFYLDKAENAMKVNNKTGEFVPDEETRMKAMDKLLKIVTGNNGASKGVTVNVNNTTNNLWANVPKPGEKLLY